MSVLMGKEGGGGEGVRLKPRHKPCNYKSLLYQNCNDLMTSVTNQSNLSLTHSIFHFIATEDSKPKLVTRKSTGDKVKYDKFSL